VLHCSADLPKDIMVVELEAELKTTLQDEDK